MAGETIREYYTEEKIKKYLGLYNALSAVLWGNLLLRLMVLYPFLGSEYVSDNVAPLLGYVQLLALLEIVHAAIGLVRSNPMTAAMQIASRLFLTWGIVRMFPQAAAHPMFTVMVAAWSITELTRYSYYWACLQGRTPAWLEWARYSLFIVLYWAGAISEAVLAYRALPAAEFFHPYYAYFIKFVLLIYPPSFYVLYSHMFKMRSKVLGKKKKGPKARKSQ